MTLHCSWIFFNSLAEHNVCIPLFYSFFPLGGSWVHSEILTHFILWNLHIAQVSGRPLSYMPLIRGNPQPLGALLVGCGVETGPPIITRISNDWIWFYFQSELYVKSNPSPHPTPQPFTHLKAIIQILFLLASWLPAFPIGKEFPWPALKALLSIPF